MANVNKNSDKGGYFLRVDNQPHEIEVVDFENPWTFYGLFRNPNSIWLTWLRKQGFLLDQDNAVCQSNIGSKEHPKICGKPC